MSDNPATAAHPQNSEPKKHSGPLSPVTGSIRLFRRWWRVAVRSGVDQQAVIDKVKEDSGFSPHYAFMNCMSAGIAILGLLLGGILVSVLLPIYDLIGNLPL